MSDLREGFEAWAKARGYDTIRYAVGEMLGAGDYQNDELYAAWLAWQAALAYIRQHDGHAEFVRAVKAFCIDRSLHRHEKLTEIESLCDRALCDVLTLIECLTEVVGAKSDRFGSAAREVLSLNQGLAPDEIFFRVTQPDQQIGTLGAALCRFFNHTLTHDCAISVSILSVQGDSFSEFLTHFPEENDPAISIETLNLPTSTAMVALKAGRMVIVEDCKKEAKTKRKRKFEPIPGSKDNEGSILCYPVRYGYAKTYPYVISIFADTSGVFQESNRRYYEWVLKLFKHRIALEHSLKILKMEASKSHGKTKQQTAN